MFGLFRPTCPIGPADKAWIELRMNWFVRAFGRERLLEAPVILPTAEFFPEPYQRTEEDIRRIFRQVCGFLRLAPDRLELDFVDPREGPRDDAVGLYEQGPPERVHLNPAEFEHPESLVATLAHELSHALLLDDGRLSREASDMEHMTDLCTVFLGLGVFGANSVIREGHKRTAALSYSWSMTSKGYLSETLYAHALAVFASARGEHKPAWAAHLRLNVREPFWASLKYLRKTGDTLFSLEGSCARTLAVAKGSEQPFSAEDLLADLRADSPSRQIAALWRISERAGANGRLPGARATGVPPEFLVPLMELLARGDRSVRESAAHTLGLLGAAAAPAVPHLLALLRERHEGLRRSALWPLAQIGVVDDDQAEEIAARLDDPDRDVRMEAARTVAHLGPKLKCAVPRLIRALGEWDHHDRALAAEALGAIGPDAAPALAVLLEILADMDDASNVAVATALGALALAGCVGYAGDAIGPDDLAQSLIMALGVRNEELRAAAAGALGGLGHAANEAVPVLAKLAGREGESRLPAAVALVRIEDDAAPLLAALRAVAPHLSAQGGMSAPAVSEPEWDRAVAAFSARHAGQIAALLESSAANDRWFAALTLAEMGPRAKSAEGELLKVHNDPVPQVRIAAASAVYNAGGSIEPLLAEFRRAHESPADNARFTPAIEGALLEIGPLALSPLVYLAGHAPESCARAAARLVARLAVLDPKAQEMLDELGRQVLPESRQLAGRIAELCAAEERQIRAHRFRTDSLPPRLPTPPSPQLIWQALEMLRRGDVESSSS